MEKEEDQGNRQGWDHQKHYQVVDLHGTDRFTWNNGTSHLYTHSCACALERGPWLQKKMLILPLLKGQILETLIVLDFLKLM